jgi:hypothetical protein
MPCTCHHAHEGNGVAVALVARILVGLGHLQDLLEEGLLVVASCYDRLVLRGHIPDARWWGVLLHGHIGLLLNDVVVLVILVFLVGGNSVTACASHG